MLKTMPAFMQIDHEFANDRDGKKFRSRQEQLVAGRERLRRRLDAGVGSADHERVRAAYDAYAAGERIVPMLWEQIKKG